MTREDTARDLYSELLHYADEFFPNGPIDGVDHADVVVSESIGEFMAYPGQIRQGRHFLYRTLTRRITQRLATVRSRFVA